MRIMFAVPLLMALGACQVTTDDANDTTSVAYNGNLAENAVEDVGNVAANVGEAITSDVQREADKVQNTNVNLTVNDHDADDGNMDSNSQ